MSLEYPEKYYVYVWFKIPRTPIYIGCGKKNRWKSRYIKELEGHQFCRIIKDGIETKKEALLFEKNLIYYLVFRYNLLNIMHNTEKCWNKRIPLEVMDAFDEVYNSLPKHMFMLYSNINLQKPPTRSL